MNFLRNASLRSRLLVLGIVAILPIALLSIANLVYIAKGRQAELERSAMDTVRALSIAVDKEISTSIAAAEILATSQKLSANDLRGFYEDARQTLHRSSGWENVSLEDTSGRQVLNLRRPFGSPLPRAADPEDVERVVRTRKPVVTNLITAPVAQDRRYVVRVPVMREDRVVYVLTVGSGPRHMREILDRQRVPPEAVVAILDRKGIVIARSRAHEESYARPASPSLLRMIGNQQEGFGITQTLENDDVYSAFMRSPVTGWIIAMGIPRATFDRPVIGAYAVISSAILISILLGIGASLLVARTITRPIHVLQELARGKRKPDDVPQIAIPELEEARNALIEAQADREKLLARERELRMLAENTSRSKDEFLAMLGHELRNPLAAITAAVQVFGVRGAPEDKGQRQAVEIIERQARQLAHLLDDLLDMGRVLTGKIVLKRAPVEFGAIVRRALEHVTTATHVRQQVHVETAPVWIDADENRIEQIVTNMLTNAIKYTPDTGTIWITLTREQEEAVLRVRDDGVGLDADLLPIVFDLFVQAGRTLERAQGGLGIGLTLVRRLTELHGGSVGVRSDGPGRGSEFEIRLPSVPGFASATKPALQTTVQPRKVLVVEDNADARDMIRMLLTLRGHDVHAAPDGSTGVKVALEIRPHVALVDIGLPGIDGYEVARNIRMRLDGEIRLVAMTGYGLPEDRERARAAGFDEHIVKPVEEAELMRVIARSASAADGARPIANYPS